MTVFKPWGFYKDIFRSEKVVFKEIVIHPGECISYQYHLERTEFWFVHSGEVSIIINDKTDVYPSGSHIMIEKYVRHQAINNGTLPCIIYEMQCGNCSEEDIIRLTDKYGRESI